MTRLIVSLHDVAPSTAEQSRRWLELIESRNIRASLLVVPGPWNGHGMDKSGSFVSWLRRAHAAGHEIVLHGWEHTRTTPSVGLRGRFGAFMGRGCEEFWNLGYADALARLTKGLAVLRGEGFEPRGFVAPGWLASPDTRRALHTLGFAYTVTHTNVVDVATNKERRAVVSSQRPASRLSTLGATGTRALVAAQVATSQPVRVAIHPDDIGEPRLRLTNLQLCDHALGRGYGAMTYIDFHYLSFARPGVQRTTSGSTTSEGGVPCA